MYLPSALPDRITWIFPEALPVNTQSVEVEVSVALAAPLIKKASSPTTTEIMAFPFDFAPFNVTFEIVPTKLSVDRVIDFSPALLEPRVTPFFPLE